jgi:hypothetical protein
MNKNQPTPHQQAAANALANLNPGATTSSPSSGTGAQLPGPANMPNQLPAQGATQSAIESALGGILKD